MLEAVVGAVAKAAIDSVAGSLADAGERHALTRAIEDALSSQATRIEAWSQLSHTLPMGVTPPVGAEAIALKFASIPRRVGYRGGATRDEADLLVQPGHVMVLGDPGAGKTTTLRRLAHRVVGLAPIDNEQWKFAILVICREEQWEDRDLLTVLSEKLGIARFAITLRESVRQLIINVLNSGAVLFVDGLDEMPPSARESIQLQITELSRVVHSGKLIASCRSGDYVAVIEGLEPAEIQPLGRDQIQSIAESWLDVGEADGFMEALDATTNAAADLADRPLFLIQMLLAYRRQGRIPDRPSDLCRTIVRLVLEDWDALRNVNRRSQYAKFGLDERLSFLADLAFHLFMNQLVRFTSDDLEKAYEKVAPQFELPIKQSRQVAREIESHTGIVVQSEDHFEFSHLSIQESLAAESVATKSSYALVGLLLSHPALIAIATARSSDASQWLADRVIHDLDDTTPDDYSSEVQILLRRIWMERPRFAKGIPLGEAVLLLLTKAPSCDLTVLRLLTESAPVVDSVKMALSSFEVRPVDEHLSLLRRPGGLYDPIVLSAQLKVRPSLLRALLGEGFVEQLLL